MIYHILNGDALVDRFRATGLAGEMLVMRECLVEGDLSGDTLDAFYQARANYLTAAYPNVQKSYPDEVRREFEKISSAPNPSEFNLWFGYDLFCRTNLWFILSLLYKLPVDKKVYVVYPSYLSENDIWFDFGRATPDQLLSCFNNRIAFGENDLHLANELWKAYKENDLFALAQLSKQPSVCFPYLEEVCQAHIDRFAGHNGKGRPERVVEELLEGDSNDFPSLFNAFFKREGIYGFGDLQVKKIYDKVLQNR